MFKFKPRAFLEGRRDEEDQDCVVHACNNFVGRRVLSPAMLVHFYRTHPDLFAGDARDWFKPLRRHSGTYFSTFLLTHWFGAANPGRRLEEARIEGRFESDRAFGQRMTRSLRRWKALWQDRFLVQKPGHLLAARKERGRWFWVDSCADEWVPFAANKGRAADIDYVFFVAQTQEQTQEQPQAQPQTQAQLSPSQP
jgi:hypothetical protein